MDSGSNNLNNLVGVNYQGIMAAEVRDNVDTDNEGKIAVFIPKIMYNTSYNEEPYDQNLSLPQNRLENIIGNDFNIDELRNSDLFDSNNDKSITMSNYIWVRPATFFNNNENNSSGSYRIPRVGSQVFVIFLDNDPQKGFYLPFGPTYNGQKLSDENTSDNWKDPNKKINIDLIRSYNNGTRIEVDTNEDSNSIIFKVPTKSEFSSNNENYKRIVIENFTSETNLNFEYSSYDTNIEVKGIEYGLKSGMYYYKNTTTDNKKSLKIDISNLDIANKRIVVKYKSICTSTISNRIEIQDENNNVIKRYTLKNNSSSSINEDNVTRIVNEIPNADSYPTSDIINSVGSEIIKFNSDNTENRYNWVDYNSGATGESISLRGNQSAYLVLDIDSDELFIKELEILELVNNEDIYNTSDNNYHLIKIEGNKNNERIIIEHASGTTLELVENKIVIHGDIEITGSLKVDGDAYSNNSLIRTFNNTQIPNGCNC